MKFVQQASIVIIIIIMIMIKQTLVRVCTLDVQEVDIHYLSYVQATGKLTCHEMFFNKNLHHYFAETKCRYLSLQKSGLFG